MRVILKCKLKEKSHNKHIFEILLTSGSHTILAFPYSKRGGAIPTGTPLTGASNAGEVGKKAILDEYQLKCLLLFILGF